MTAALAAVGVATLVTGFIVIGTAGAVQADDSPVAPNEHQIAICHATGGGKYSIPYPAKKQISDDNGHRSGGGVHPEDIIPPFPAGGEGGSAWGAFVGQNWDAAGQATYANGCGTPADKRVSPVYPTVEPPTCDADGYLEVPGEQPAGVVVEAGATDGAGPGTYTFRYAAMDGYILVGDNEVTVTVLPRLTGATCDEGRPLELPAAPQPTAPTCDVAGSFTLPADTGELDWSISPTYAGVGNYTVRVDALGGKKFTHGFTYKTWPITVLPQLTGPQCGEVRPLEIPATPQVTGPTCDVAGSFTLPADTGELDWSISPTYAGVGSYTVRVDALGGKKFTDGSTYRTWPITVLPQLTGAECEEPPPPVKDVCTNLSGVQPDVPKGYTEQDGICTEIEVLPTEALDVCTNIKGAQAAVPAGLEAQDGRCVKPAEEKPDEVVGPDEVLGTAEAVPTAVDAGLGGPTVQTAPTRSPLGEGLVGAGLVMMLLAGAMQMGRARGAHQV